MSERRWRYISTCTCTYLTHNTINKLVPSVCIHNIQIYSCKYPSVSMPALILRVYTSVGNSELIYVSYMHGFA